MQHVDGIADVEALSEPSGFRCARVDGDAFGGVLCAKHRNGIGRYRRSRRHCEDDGAVRPPEAQLAVRLSLDLKSFFVNRAVVSTTQHREIRQGCGTAVRPMADVMTLPELASAAGEATALVAMFKRTP
jgi:hypothetical protein